MTKPVSVTVIDNGPLKISGEAVSVHYCGEALESPAGKDVYLCRCGESSNAPYCDGSHSRTGFVGASEPGEKKEIRVWEGRTIKTYFNSNTCMHVFLCKPLKELRQRELDGDDSAAEEIARVVRTCPSGALSFEAKDVSTPSPIDGPDVDIMEGGEVRIQVPFEINAELQERQAEDRATLCRCGQSKNKPFCDGTHKAAGFEAE